MAGSLCCIILLMFNVVSPNAVDRFAVGCLDFCAEFSRELYRGFRSKCLMINQLNAIVLIFNVLE